MRAVCSGHAPGKCEEQREGEHDESDDDVSGVQADERVVRRAEKIGRDGQTSRDR